MGQPKNVREFGDFILFVLLQSHEEAGAEVKSRVSLLNAVFFPLNNSTWLQETLKENCVGLLGVR